jgi:hypothetical protein
MDINRRNRDIKKEIYPQVMGETTYTKLLTTMGYQEGRFIFFLLEYKVPKPLSPTNYKETQINQKMGNIQPIGIIDLH